jgi:hypothetical protein
MSAIPTVKAALVAQLGVLFSSAQVCYGQPLKALRDDIVGVMDARDTPVPDGIGRQRRSTIDIDVVFSVFRGGTDQAAAEVVCDGMVEDFEAWLLANPSIAGTAQGNAGVVARTAETQQTDRGALAEQAVTVRVFAAY